MLLSVVIPVYNERRTLGAVLTTVARSLPEVSKEIIVVDDCSTDGRGSGCRPISSMGRAADR
jgi:glycosyltransferase involved in cell wall biosynthesis